MRLFRKFCSRAGWAAGLVAMGVLLAANVAFAAPQTLTILGSYGSPGQIDPYTDFSLDGGNTWSPAYLSGWHPWGFVPGTNSWVNCAPSANACLNQTVLYRVRFTVPSGWSNPQMQLQVKADNAATMWLNGSQIGDRIVGAGGTTADATLATILQTGLNEIRLAVEDWGGLAGFNYRIDLNIDAPTPPSTLPGTGGATDETGPEISYTINPDANANGWRNTDTTITFTCTDADSDVASCPAPVVLTQEGENLGVTVTAADTAGNETSLTVAGINIDKTPPSVAYSGNAGTYTVDQSVGITCSASDSLSGLAGSQCDDISGPAYGFNLGENTFSASATDLADNTGSATASFNVVVTHGSLCNLTQQFVTKKGVAQSLCAKLDAAAAAAGRGNDKAAANIMGAYVNEVSAQSGKALTHEQAAILTQLANEL